MAEIETDKATLAWENQEDGFIAKILIPAGAKDIPVGTPLAVLVEDKDDIVKVADYQPSAASDASSSSASEAAPSAGACQD